jgi:hypothetical protein
MVLAHDLGEGPRAQPVSQRMGRLPFEARSGEKISHVTPNVSLAAHEVHRAWADPAAASILNEAPVRLEEAKMAEGVLIVLSDPTAKKETAFHDWYPSFFESFLAMPGVVSGRRLMFAKKQVDLRAVQTQLAIFELSDVEAARNAVAERYGVKTSKEELRLDPEIDGQTIMPTFFETIGEPTVVAGAPELPADQECVMLSLLAVSLSTQPTFAEAYTERMQELLKLPGQIAGQLYQLSKHQIQNPIYPFIAVYRVADKEQILEQWPAPGTNWRSIAAMREKDPSVRPDGRLAGMKNRDFVFEPYVKPDPPPPPAPKAPPAKKEA